MFEGTKSDLQPNPTQLLALGLGIHGIGYFKQVWKQALKFSVSALSIDEEVLTSIDEYVLTSIDEYVLMSINKEVLMSIHARNRGDESPFVERDEIYREIYGDPIYNVYEDDVRIVDFVFNDDSFANLICAKIVQHEIRAGRVSCKFLVSFKLCKFWARSEDSALCEIRI
ncbi:hypothetical protein F2Q70_00004055 [Brassica cretica]|uniref:Uncharacterized protein n=1 Tax=Brassica cretica TaxID=69181 RepID=A0A8S9IM00_BRACR|nr:hypothetical protein F2Q70_00004055 [Brassica cretica]